MGSASAPARLSSQDGRDGRDGDSRQAKACPVEGRLRGEGQKVILSLARSTSAFSRQHAELERALSVDASATASSNPNTAGPMVAAAALGKPFPPTLNPLRSSFSVRYLGGRWLQP
ncbi:unnamed protein product [Urochloa humidicola]